MGVGQPLSMKLKNVHFPHPHPNGDFCDPALEGGLVLPLCLAALVVWQSEVSTPAVVAAVNVPSEVVVLLYWLANSAEKRIHAQLICYIHCIYTHVCTLTS